MFQLTAVTPGSPAKAWEKLAHALGLDGAGQGQAWKGPAGTPPIGGVIHEVGEGVHPHRILRLEAPAPGSAFLTACGMGDQVYLSASFYLYGDQASAAVSREEPLWQAWLSEQFPAQA